MKHSPVMNSDVTTIEPSVAMAQTAPDAVTLMFPKLSGPSAPATKDTRTIRRLVRHRVTRLYFNEAGWTPDPLQATVFFDVLEAAQTCARRGLTDVELALHLGAGALDFFSTPLR
jgi:hypothetical protein